jgi:antitoxin component YwqK of YwqJK toxin-antitoxin module
MLNVREKILEKLAKLEANREETLEKLKEKEISYFSKIIILFDVMLILVLGVYIYFDLLMAKYEYNYVSVLDFCTSPYYLSSKLSIVIMLILNIICLASIRIKINLKENPYIKINLSKKIYFDDIKLVEIGKYGDIDITDKAGKKARITVVMNNLAKILFILKENLKAGTVVIKKDEEKKESFVKEIFKVIGVYIFIKCIIILAGSIEDNISEKYRYNLDFSKYGIVREELSDGGYAEYNYKHGKKNGLAKHYDFSGAVVKEIEYKNNEKLKEKEYTSNGMIAKEREYDKNGNEKVKKYSSEGKVKEELTIEGDICKRKLYTESGSLILEETTVNYMRYGDKKIVYYPNGKIFMKAEFNEKGRLLPPLKVYDENGRLRLEEEYNKKQEFYTHRIFDENGKLIKTKEKLVSSWQEVYSMKIAIINYFEKDEIYENEIEMFKNFLENEK